MVTKHEDWKKKRKKQLNMIRNALKVQATELTKSGIDSSTELTVIQAQLDVIAYKIDMREI